MTAAINVVIATGLRAERADALERAVGSVLYEQSVSAVPVIVGNGRAADPRVRQRWENDKSVRFYFLEEGNYALARHVGRLKVDAEYFCYLDDDDEYLPGALELRIGILRNDRSVDAVVTNGILNVDGAERRHISRLPEMTEDRLHALMKANWLASCGGMFRAHSVSSDYFVADMKYCEWTITAFLLARNRRRVCFAEDLTYRCNDTAESLSKSEGYELGVYAGYDWMLERCPDDVVAGMLREKKVRAANSLAERFRAQGRRADAWRWHARTLAQKGGWKYATYTRKLLGWP